jgi:hypothetical protein
MFKKEIEESQRKLIDSVDEQDKIQKHIDSLEAIDKYLSITEFKNNWINEGKIIEFEDAINGKVIILAFKVNGKDMQFKFIVGRLNNGRSMDEEIRMRFSQEFAQYIYNQIKK